MTKHDERREKSESLKEQLANTRENMENTKAVISQTDDENLREDLKQANERREKAIKGFQYELEDEIAYKKPER